MEPEEEPCGAAVREVFEEVNEPEIFQIFVSIFRALNDQFPKASYSAIVSTKKCHFVKAKYQIRARSVTFMLSWS